ncbi:DNA-directed RNA polymerase subunit alpha [Candidatus Saccharibacteria bacterium]|nr:DNA-directed RNA polymerase subunit alpha [Candidatus Saccharibacteria bacterium]
MTTKSILPQLTITESDDPSQAEFLIEPLAPGFGTTIGNSLRRVLLSSLSGAAVTSVKIKGADHEFSTLSGVKEDVISILLNIKLLRIDYQGDAPLKFILKKTGQGQVKAGDIKTSNDAKIINPELVIATLDGAKTQFEMEMVVETGIGYYSTEDHPEDEQLPVGSILVDALFTPIRKVNFKVENTRVGQRTNFDKLIISIQTNQTISAEQAFNQANQILIGQYQTILSPKATVVTEVESMEVGVENEDDILITEIGFSPRTANALGKNQILTVSQLRNLDDKQLSSMKGFGAKALEEVKLKISEF